MELLQEFGESQSPRAGRGPHRSENASSLAAGRARSPKGSLADNDRSPLGLRPFESSRSYASAATELLHDTQSVCIVHNRDQVYTLIRMFPNARVLALPHDLCLHAFKPSSKNGPTPLVARSQLRELLGGPYAECNGSIIMHGEVMDAILRTCPKVMLASLVPLPKVGGFRHLRSLEIAIHVCAEIPDVDSALTGLLTKRPGLKELGLFRGSGVRLSTIARLCPKLKSLKLVDCLGSPEDVPVEAQAFPNLQFVQMDMPLSKTCFDAFFSATRSRLRTARFFNNFCAEFLHHALQCSDRLPFPCLENLTLNTNESLSQLQLKAEDLPNFAKALPALRHLETDIFELRLFIENFYAPRTGDAFMERLRLL
ncbi:hypothetical protein MRX96_025522 [Rhipicephalus microplus]